MKGSFKLSLALALALFGGNAFALGLGTIQLKSRLDQPLNAEIPLIAAKPSEVAALKVGLASSEDFQRVGLNRARVSVPLEFSVGTNSSGQAVIKVTTKDPVREPFLDFLVEANWPNGKVLREYTVLLNPPVMAAAIKGSSASVSPAHEAPRAQPHKLAESHKAKPKPKPVRPPHTVAHAKPARKPAPTPKPSAAPPAAAATSEPGQYGPVAQGETLSAIARATRPSDSTDLDAYMLAMLKANPNAFFKDNINALKRGAILRIPSADDIRASGTAAEVLAAVRAQNQAWAAGAPVARPTLVAKTGAPKPKKSKAPKNTARSASSAAAGSGHLALVPPRANKNGKATADRPGSSSGSGRGASSADLARTKEALASREQEVGELKSRVKELEDIHGKDQRLLSMKDSELAQLQDKLKKLQAAENAAPATTPAAPPAAPPAEKTPAAATAAGAPAETAAAKSPPKITAKDIWGDINAGGSTSSVKESTPASEPNAAAAPAPAAPTTAASQPANAPASASTAMEAAPAVKSPARTMPVKSPPPPKVRPIPSPPAPWYMDSNVLYGGGAILLLIGLILLMRVSRRPKLQPRPQATGPAGLDIDDFDMPTEDTAVAEEHELLNRLSANPGDTDASLELLSLYYANGDAARFEAAAEDMYAHVADPNQPDWQKVRSMGEELCPQNPLFGGPEDLRATAGHVDDATPHAAEPDVYETSTHLDSGLQHENETTLEREIDLSGAGEQAAHEHEATDEDEGFDFDLTEHAAPAPPPPAPAPAEEPAAGHGDDEAKTVVAGATLPDFPSLEPEPHVDTEAAQEPAPPPQAAHVAEAAQPAEPVAEPEHAAAGADEDLIASEDAIGTKLDLAKAYMDMGDPEGARSMLDEVMAEGNDAQKDEARKLLAEIH